VNSACGGKFNFLSGFFSGFEEPERAKEAEEEK
jgi:hypothetical protein